jgi:hypothetical protein
LALQRKKIAKFNIVQFQSLCRFIIIIYANTITTIQNIPIPTKTGREILSKAAISLPKVLPKFTANVHTKKKLRNERTQM